MQLVFFAYDHTTATPTPPIQSIAALYKPFDLVDALPDGANLGTQTLVHPWFRIIQTSLLTLPQIQTLLSPLLPVLDVNNVPTTLWQRRGKFLNLQAPSVQSLLTPQWWGDTSRATAVLSVGSTALSFNYSAMLATRAAIADPAYPGLGGAVVVKP